LNSLALFKGHLGGAYEFTQKYTNQEVQKIMKSNSPEYADEVPYSLAAGCVNLEMTLFYNGKRLYAGYDVCVRSTEAPMQWSSYSSLPDKVNLKAEDMEEEMFRILDEFVMKNNLSYTELNELKGVDIQSNYPDMEF